MTSSKQSKSNGRQALGFRITPRDIDVTQKVYECRALSSHQIQRLFFTDNPSGVQCRLRLRHLSRSGFLHMEEQLTLLSEGNKPRVYWLDIKGAQFLADLFQIEERELDWRPGEWEVGPQFVQHLLKTNDIRIAFTQSAQQHGFTLQNWLDERVLKRHQAEDMVEILGPKGAKQKAAAIADGHFELITDRRTYHFSLETDLRTITGRASAWAKNERDWARRVQVILAYYNSGKYEQRYGTTSMRWLTVTTGEKRLENLKHITSQVGGKTRFWFTTFDRISSNDIIVDPIWSISGREGLYPLID